jgi:hypothetical protein
VTREDNNNNNNIGQNLGNYNIELPFPSKPLVSLCLTQFPLYAVRKKLRRSYSFACRPPGLERLLTGEFPRNFLLVLLTFSVFG